MCSPWRNRKTPKSSLRILSALAKPIRWLSPLEGVETAEQLKRLKQYHCDEAQGYFIGKPVALDALNLDVAFSV